MTATSQILLALVHNIALFLVFVAAYSVLRPRLEGKAAWITSGAAGCVFGLAAVLAMATPFQLGDGIIIDGRAIVISTGTLISGPVSGGLAFIIAATYRAALGGAGALAGSAALVVTYAVSSLWWLVTIHRKHRLTAPTFAALGFVAAAASFPTFLLLPAGQTVTWAPGSASVALLIMTPLGNLLLGWMLLREQERAALVAQRAIVMEELRVTKERFELAVAGSHDGIFDHDLTTGLVWTSARYREIRGYDDAPDVCPATFWFATMLAEDSPLLLAQLEELKRGQRDRIDLIFCVRHQTGRIVYVHSRAQAVRNATGEVVRVVGANADVTHMLQAERRLKSAIDNMECGFALFDSDDRLVVYNEGFVDEGTRRNFGDPTGRTFEEIFRAFALDEKSTAVAAMPDREAWFRWRMEQHRNPPDKPLEIEWTDGRWVRVTERKTADGGYVGIWTDITDQKRREIEVQYSRDQVETQASQLAELAEQLEIERQSAEGANTEKSRFLASMSHELRTPLNAILAFPISSAMRFMVPSCRIGIASMFSSFTTAVAISFR